MRREYVDARLDATRPATVEELTKLADARGPYECPRCDGQLDYTDEKRTDESVGYVFEHAFVDSGADGCEFSFIEWNSLVPDTLASEDDYEVSVKIPRWYIENERGDYWSRAEFWSNIDSGGGVATYTVRALLAKWMRQLEDAVNLNDAALMLGDEIVSLLEDDDADSIHPGNG